MWYTFDMENTELSQQQDIEKEKQKDYEKAVEAVNSLYEMSLSGVADDDKVTINQLISTIGTFGKFQDKLTEGGGQKVGPDFFDTIKVLNKMARIHTNFCLGKSLFFDRDIMLLSEDARYVLWQGLLVVDEETIKQLDEEKAADFFESIKLILTSKSDEAIEWAVDFLSKSADLYAGRSKDETSSNMEDRVEELQGFLETREFERALVHAVQEGINLRSHGQKKLLIEHCEPILKSILAKYGFDPEEVIETWSGSYTEYRLQPQIERNMTAVFGLEDKRPGIAKLLYKEFGIRNFERYPDSILLTQFDEFKDTEKPYGVMLQATHDWDGAFSSGSKRIIWERMFGQISGRYGFRIVEAKSKMEVIRRLVNLDRKYGEHHKLSFAFIGGHGNKLSITFGGEHRRNILLYNDLLGKGSGKVRGFFEPNPTIVLASCSTGVEGGIGQKLSEVIGAKVIAPRIDTTLSGVDAVMHDGEIDFVVKYIEDKSGEEVEKTYTNGAVR